MPDVDAPWVGLVALATMFLLPFAPAWLFEGPRTVKHYSRRHVCGDCGAAWTDDHACIDDRAPTTELVPADRPLRAELRRGRPSTVLVRRSTRASEIDKF
jgi:hypothetical protein